MVSRKRSLEAGYPEGKPGLAANIEEARKAFEAEEGTAIADEGRRSLRRHLGRSRGVEECGERGVGLPVGEADKDVRGASCLARKIQLCAEDEPGVTVGR